MLNNMKKLFAASGPLALVTLFGCPPGSVDEHREIGVSTAAAKPCAVGEITDAVLERAKIRKVEDVRQFERAGIKSERGVVAFGDRTRPSLDHPSTPAGTMRDPSAPGLDDATARGYRRENESAQLLAEKGYGVEVLPETKGGNGYGIDPKASPDFLIEGRPFDNYAPNTSSLRNVWGVVDTKTTQQANRIVLNLDGAPFGTAEMTSYFQEHPLQELAEIIGVQIRTS